MAIQIRKAQKQKALLRLALAGPAGSGKTMSSLKLAKGIGDKILLIDTEHHSGDLYGDLFEYDIIDLTPPYKPEKYIEAIKAGEDARYDVIIVDSLSHAWTDEGGLLDQADKLQSGGMQGFRVWSNITPQHRRLVNAMLNCSTHLIGTMRSKQQYAMETDDRGKTSVKKLGLAPVQREGMEYEFTVVMDIDQNHHARVSKDRTNMFHDETFMIDRTTGERLKQWLNSGIEPIVDYTKQKSRISQQLKMLGHTPKTASEAQKTIMILTDCELESTNYDKIIDRLEILIKEKREADREQKKNNDTSDKTTPGASQ
jgi:hypothetical protein